MSAPATFGSESGSQVSASYALSDVGEMRTLYDKWAATYDKNMDKEGQDYVGPVVAASYVLKSLGTREIDDDLEILDAGCGTGLVGVQLAKAGAKKVDGVDLSPGMLEIARKAGVYRALDTTDLTQPLAKGDGAYDVVVCIGTFTQGHVGPEAFGELVRVVKRGGFVISTVLDLIWEDGGYRAKVESMAQEGKVKVVSSEVEDYRRAEGVRARVVVLQVL